MPIIFISEGEDFPAKLERIRITALERGVELSAIQVSKEVHPGACRLLLTIEELKELLALFKLLTKANLSEETFCTVLTYLLNSKCKTIDTLLGMFRARLLPDGLLKTFLSALNVSSECINSFLSQLFNEPHFRDCIIQHHDWLVVQNPELMATTEIQMLIDAYSRHGSRAASCSPPQAAESYTLSIRDLPEFTKRVYPGVTDLTLTPRYNARVELNKDIIVKLRTTFPDLKIIRTNSPCTTKEVLDYLEIERILLIVQDETTTTLISGPVPDDPFDTMLEFSRDPVRLPVLLESYRNPAIFSVILVNHESFLKRFLEVCSSDQKNFESVFLYWSLKEEGRNFILKLLDNSSDRGNNEAFLVKFLNSKGFIPALTAPFWREGKLISPLHCISVSIKFLNTLFRIEFFNPDQQAFLAKLIFSRNGLEILNNIYSFLPQTDQEYSYKRSVLQFIAILKPHKTTYEDISIETCLFAREQLCIKEKIPLWRKTFTKNPELWSELKSSAFFRESLLDNNGTSPSPSPSVLSCWLKNREMRAMVKDEIIPLVVENNRDALVAWLYGKYDDGSSNLCALFLKKELVEITHSFKSIIAQCITPENLNVLLPLLFELHVANKTTSCLLMDLAHHNDQEYLSSLFSTSNSKHLVEYCTKISKYCSEISIKEPPSNFLASLRSPIFFNTLIILKKTVAGKFVDTVLPLYVNQLLAFLLTEAKTGRFNKESERDSWHQLFTSEAFITIYKALKFQKSANHQAFFEYCHQTLYLSKREEDRQLLRVIISHQGLQDELHQLSTKGVIKQLKEFFKPSQKSSKPVSIPKPSNVAEPAHVEPPPQRAEQQVERRPKKSKAAKPPTEVKQEIQNFFRALCNAIEGKSLPIEALSEIQGSLVSFINDPQQKSKLKGLLELSPTIPHQHLYNLVTLMLINSNFLKIEHRHEDPIQTICSALISDASNLYRNLYVHLTDQLLYLYVVSKTEIPALVLEVLFARIINLEDNDFLNRIISAQPPKAGNNVYSWVREQLEKSGAPGRQQKTVLDSFLRSSSLPTVTRRAKPREVSPLLKECLASLPDNLPVIAPGTSFHRPDFLIKVKNIALEDLILALLDVDEEKAAVALVGSQAATYSSGQEFNPEKDVDLEIVYAECKLSDAEKIRKPHDVLLNIASRVSGLHGISIQAQGDGEDYFWVSAKAMHGKIPLDFRFVFTALNLKSAINCTRSARVISTSATFIDITNACLYAGSNSMSLMKPFNSLTLLNLGYILSECYLKEPCQIESELQLLLKVILIRPENAKLREDLKPICLELVSKKTGKGDLTAESIFAKVTEIVKREPQASLVAGMFGRAAQHRENPSTVTEARALLPFQ